MLIRKFEPRWLVIFGVLVCASGMFMMARFNLNLDFATAVKSRIVQSLGLAFLFVPISAAAFALIPKEKTNYAAGLFNLARNIGGSSGIATVVTLLARRSQYHQSVLGAHVTQYDATYREMMAGTAANIQSHGASAPDAIRQAHGVLYGMVQRHSAMLAFADAFWLMAVMFLAVLPLMFFMKRAPVGRGSAGAAAH
jgi:DHA2 family multidrug resistance protein